MDGHRANQLTGLGNKENNRNQPNATGTTVRTGPVTKSDAPVRAYAMADFYRQKKEQQMKKLKDEEERLRRHKAKPMPNFKAIHSRVTTANTAGACLSPETPEVLRRGIAMKEKQQQKIKEYEAKQAERPPIVTRSTKVLTEEPFVPKLEPHPEVKIVPFNLGMEKRLLQRKEYDENYQRQLAEKKEQEEERKKKEESMIRQAQRERTTFKARPNPFMKSS